MTKARETEQWSAAHLAVTDLMTELLSLLRDKGYNPSNHISYDRTEHHLLLEKKIPAQHFDVKSVYDAYLEACRKRDDELDRVQDMPKTNLGF